MERRSILLEGITLTERTGVSIHGNCEKVFASLRKYAKENAIKNGHQLTLIIKVSQLRDAILG